MLIAITEVQEAAVAANFRQKFLTLHLSRGLPWIVAEGQAIDLDVCVRQPAGVAALSLQFL